MTLPPWPTRSKRERQQILKWSSDQIDERLSKREQNANANHAAYFYWLKSDKRAKEAARAGDYAPLRKRYPDLAEFLNPPKRKRRQKKSRPPSPRVDLVTATLQLIPIVQDIWKDHFDKRNKFCGYGPSALQIAAEYEGVSDAALDAKRHNAKRSLLTK
jgi:hypothetical protein